MGTSKAYPTPSTPQWGKLKSKITRTVQKDHISTNGIVSIIRDFTEANGGNKDYATNSNNAGGRIARTVGKNLSGFISRIGSVGWSQVIQEIESAYGLTNLFGKPVDEILIILVDYISENASEIEAVDAREALSQLFDFYLNGKTQTEIGDLFESMRTDNALFEGFIGKFFGLFIYQQFCRFRFEDLINRVGLTKAESFLNQIKDVITSEIEGLPLIGLNVMTIDWKGTQGEKIISDVFTTILEIFG